MNSIFNNSENNKVLLVDDEIFILSSIERQLCGEYDLLTAKSGEEALEIIEKNPSIAVVISDMRMPKMDGITLLTMIQKQYPKIVKVMLTGNRNSDIAMEAVNRANIYRFLQKPCKPEELRQVINEALEQYNLQNIEKILFEKTVNAAISIMMDILEITCPISFLHTKKVREISKALAEEVGLSDLWIIDTAAMLSQIGTITIPTNILNKIHEGKGLTAEEKSLYKSHPETGYDLIKRIPGLEMVANIIKNQLNNYRTMHMIIEDNSAYEMCAAAILRIANDYEIFKERGFGHSDIIDEMKYNSDEYNIVLINILEKNADKYSFVKKSIKVKVEKLVIGMIIEKDVINDSGALITRKGHSITETLKKILVNNYKQGNIKEELLISLPEYFSSEYFLDNQ